MGEILNAIRLKDRIIIGVVLSVFAVLIAGSAGAITYASINNHNHVYDNYNLEKTEEGDFYFVGTCTREKCKNPHHYISSEDFDVIEKIITEPTCNSEGEKQFYAELIINGKKVGFTYSETEKIPMLPHAYAHEGAVDLAAGTVTLKCGNEGCTGELVLNTEDIVLDSTDKGNCSKPQTDTYNYTVDGVSGSFTASYDIENASHVLCGQLVSEYLPQYEIGTNTYMYGTEGIKTLDNIDSTPTGCGWEVPAFYQCEGCGKVESVWIGLPDHDFSIVEGSFTEANFDQLGQVSIKCGNTGCGEVKKINLPKADKETNTTLLSTDEENKKQTWKYSYYSEKYKYTVEYEFVTDWVHDHVFVHDPSLTEAPSLDLQGISIVKCTVDDCNLTKRIVLPKVKIDENAVLIVPDETELTGKVVRYTYTSEVYGFTEVLEIEITKPLSHNYVFYLEPLNGRYIVVARCDQPECQMKEFIKEENVVPVYTNTSTCNTYGEEIWSHPTDSSVVPFVIPSFDLMGHNIQCGVDDIIEAPTLTTEGKAVAKCVNEGCTESHEITLPMIDLSDEGNSEIIEIDDENGNQTAKYTYTYKDEEKGIDITIETEIVINEAHTHDFYKELVLSDGEFIFDLVTRCKVDACSFEERKKNVPATLVVNTVSCTDPGYQVWNHIDEDGTVYPCTIINFEAEGHFMDYDPDADTTVNPTFESAGSIVVYCNNGCNTQTRTVELPKMVEGENTVFLKEVEFQLAYSYTHITEDGIRIDLILVFAK